MKASPLSGWKETLRRPPWRTLVPLFTFLLLMALVYLFWTPGRDVRDGRHDLGRNGVWLQHGWLGADSWFTENNRTDRLPKFRNQERIRELATLLRANHITDVFPHLCPTQPRGEIMPVDEKQIRLFLDEFNGFRVMPWVGGVFQSDVMPDSAERRRVFIRSIVNLLNKYPELAGIHLNVEPWPSGNREMLTLLDELHQALPPGKILSVAAYPPPTRWHPFPDVHWDEAYFKEVASRVDQMAVMMYDTALRDGKMYQQVMAVWTKQILTWTSETGERPPEILLGVPTYEDEGVGYHHPDVENLPNSLQGIHAGLASFATLPQNYQGAAIYSEWVTSPAEWQEWRGRFCRH